MEKRQQFQKGEKHARGNADRDQRRDARLRGFIDVEPPSIRRKGFQLDKQTGQQEHQRGEADRTGDSVTPANQIIDVQHAGHGVEQHRAEQEKRRRYNGGHEIFKRCRQGRRRVLQAEQPVSGNRDNLEKHEEIEKIARHYHALDAHHHDQVDQHHRVLGAHEIDGAEQADQA